MPDKSGYRRSAFGADSTSPVSALIRNQPTKLQVSNTFFANKKDFGGDDNARQTLGSVLI
jgi:hypothetical protein